MPAARKPRTSSSLRRIGGDHKILATRPACGKRGPMTSPIFAFMGMAPQEWGILGIAVVLVACGSFALGRRRRVEPAPVTSAAVPGLAVAGPRAEAEVIGFLSLLQEKGRLIDFLMDDVTGYSDTEVGAAARVVHQGCRAVLEEHLSVEPIAQEAEGAQVTLPVGYAASDYRLLGKVSGDPPYRGTLVHQGWKPARLNLPRTIGPEGSLPNIAAAQVELS